MKKRIRMQGIIIFVLVITAVLFSKFLFYTRKTAVLDESLDTAGLVMILSGFLLRISARGYKEENSSQGKKLVTDGPYALVRNPMYFGTLLIWIGVVFCLLALWVFFILAGIFLFIYIPQIKKEEKSLAEYFGDEFTSYRKKTSLFFPRFGALVRINRCLPLRLPWIKKELSSLALVLAVLFAIEIFEEAQVSGVKAIPGELLEFLLVVSVFVLLGAFYLRREI